MKTVIVTGGFDPLHSGHIEYFKAARELGDRLWVGVNSDAWLIRKKGMPFMSFDERCSIISNLYMVDKVIRVLGDDVSDHSAGAIFYAQTLGCEEIIFANGGDREYDTTPEIDAYNHDRSVKFVFGVGGNTKKNSSRWILRNWSMPKTDRIWGYYRVLHENGKEVKVKELTVESRKRLSMQRHKDRAEHWFVAEGTATVYTLNASTDYEVLGEFPTHSSIHIQRNQWHQLSNETDIPLKVVEIQYGDNCIEEDIERR